MMTTNKSGLSYLRWHYASRLVVERLDGVAIGYYKVIGVDPCAGTVSIRPAYSKPKVETHVPYKRKLISYVYDNITDKRR